MKITHPIHYQVLSNYLAKREKGNMRLRVVISIFLMICLAACKKEVVKLDYDAFGSNLSSTFQLTETQLLDILSEANYELHSGEEEGYYTFSENVGQMEFDVELQFYTYGDIEYKRLAWYRKTWKTDEYTEELRSLVSEIRKTLVSKYGNPMNTEEYDDNDYYDLVNYEIAWGYKGAVTFQFIYNGSEYKIIFTEYHPDMIKEFIG